MYEHEQPEPEQPAQPERYTGAAYFPKEPVEPITFAKSVREKLNKLDPNLIIPNDMEYIFSDMCKGFNECIRLNNSEEVAQTIVYSPKTGSAKTVTAKMYIAHLVNESSIVIVPTVKDAIRFAEDVNTWQSDGGYAKCYYKISDDNKDDINRVDINKLKNYRCIIITHKMFEVSLKNERQSNQDSIIKLLRNHRGKTRDFVLVDERLDLYRKEVVELNLLDEAIRVLKEVQLIHKSFNISSDLEKLENLSEKFKLSLEDKLILPAAFDGSKRQSLSILPIEFDTILTESFSQDINFSKIIDKFSKSHSAEYENSLTKSMRELFTAIEFITHNDFLVTKSSDSYKLLCTENIINSYGSNVVLDATAKINQIYNTTALYKNKNFKHVDTIEPRIYKSLTIYKAKGYDQTKRSISGNNKLINEYKKTIKGLIQDDNDKILVITHKALLTKFETIDNPQVQYTSWGNHVGKNDWKDCNKIIVIGWFYKTSDVYLSSYLNATGSVKLALECNIKEQQEIYKQTQLADDLIQATMRGTARKIRSKDGNCSPCEVYLFYPDTNDGEEVIRLFESEFPKADFNEWTPKPKGLTPKISKTNNNIDILLKLLLKIGATQHEITQANLVKQHGYNRSTLSDLFKNKKTIEVLKQNGITIDNPARGHTKTIKLSSI